MTPTIGAVMFIHNGIEFDYNFLETIECMKAFADQVVILDAGSTDGTADLCARQVDYKTRMVGRTTEEWLAQKGKEKLAYFQNEAKKYLDTDYYMVVQADEIVHEQSFPIIREAIGYGQEAYMCRRLNLWFDPWHELSVPLNRMPCSPEVIRIAKLEYDSTGDGENIDCGDVCMEFIPDIRIYHLGFVRRREVMKAKIVHIQEEVFQTPHDARLDEDELFNPARYFSPTDVKPITEPLPKFIQAWAHERYPYGSI